jgi:pimeloyl-ACP methyl ester carboxylesterase
MAASISISSKASSTSSSLATTQRAVTQEALTELATSPAWKTIPSWFIYGDADKNIPPAANSFMAERAKSQKTVIVPGASHLVMASHPDAVAELIKAAAAVK